MKKSVFLSVIFLFLAGCMVGPNYHVPESEVSGSWVSASLEKAEDISEELPLSQWWKGFQDPLLDGYVCLAQENNNELLAAEENILQARALSQIASSKLYPQLSADMNAKRSQYSEKGFLSFAKQLPAVHVPPIQNLFNALFDASWEIDLFGKTRRLTQVADAFVGRQIEKKNDLLLTITAEVARNYFQVRGNQKLVLLAQEKINLLEQTLKIEKRRFEMGYVDGVSLSQIEAEKAFVQAELPPLQAQVYSGIYALSILTGNSPGAFLDEMTPFVPLPSSPDLIDIGLQSDLLRRRPDVREKERELAAATALIGVAVASFYPSFSLTADSGFQALQIKDLFKGASKVWSVGADLLMPLFQGGRLVGQLRAAEASTASAAFSYQQTILKALEDVESSLTVYLNERSRTHFLDGNVHWNRKKVRIGQQQYEKGLVSKVVYLDMQRGLNSDEQTLVQSRLSTLTDLVALYKALGGGWEAE